MFHALAWVSKILQLKNIKDSMHRQEHLWLLSNGDGDCVTFHRLTAYHLFLASYFVATLTTGTERGSDTLWSSSEIFFTRQLTEFMKKKMLSGNKKKICIFQRSALRTGVCAYKDTTPLLTKDPLLLASYSRSLVNLFCVWSKSIFCLFLFTPFHKKF